MNGNMCRICFGQELLMSIFKKRGSLTISSKIMTVARVYISPEDDLPNTICHRCVQKLDICLEFKELCESSEKKLRALLKKRNDENLIITKCDSKDVQFTSNNDNLCLSPQSDTDRELLIDEDVNQSENVQISDEFNQNESKGNINIERTIAEKKTQKQQCFTCGKVMSSRFRLKTHLRTHTGERPFSCLHCGKNFSLAQNLKVHLRTHTGEKPLQCSICGESFAQSAGLAAHRRKHTGQTPYQCLLCPRSFRTIGHLQYHTRRHTGEKNFECDTCGRAFITRSDLKQHILTHTGERPHVCCVCGLRLTRASHLKRHLQLTHRGQQAYPCTVCNLKFSKKVDLDNHSKKHEQESDSS